MEESRDHSVEENMLHLQQKLSNDRKELAEQEKLISQAGKNQQGYVDFIRSKMPSDYSVVKNRVKGGMNSVYEYGQNLIKPKQADQKKNVRKSKPSQAMAEVKYDSSFDNTNA